MGGKRKDQKLKDLTFEKFKDLARDRSLSPYEKIGFYDKYRAGKEGFIFKDVLGKVRNLHQRNKTIVDIGPGCSELPLKFIELCNRQGHRLVLIDSKDMLDQLPNESFITKIPAKYPVECSRLFKELERKVDTIIAYSVLHYIVKDVNLIEFLDKSLKLLADGGEMLIGDIPNASKRKRFLSSKNGIRFHQENNHTREVPTVHFNTLEEGEIDDALVFFILSRCRNSGFDSYLLSQSEDLPMSNRREDILIVRP